MKRLFCCSIALTFYTSLWAQASLWCNYKDYFHLSEDSSKDIRILRGNTDGNMYFLALTEQKFLLTDAPSCKEGRAAVLYGQGEDHWCFVYITDGPYRYSPKISASCHGLRYDGYTYDGFNSHSYTLHIR